MTLEIIKMLGQIRSPNNENLKFYGLWKEIDEKLFRKCKKHSIFLFILDLFHTKCLNRWSNKFFSKLLTH